MSTHAPDDNETEAIERIRALHHEGKSLRQVADILAAEGHRPKRSDRWHPETLRRIIARLDSPKRY